MLTLLEKGQLAGQNISKKYKCLAPFLIATFCCIGLSIALILVLTLKYAMGHCKSHPNNLTQQHLFSHAAVASDAGPCANIANNIMMVKGGNGVDGAIAGMICSCAVNFHSCGIGGGALIVIYIKKDRKVYTIDLREQAPASAYSSMFVNDSEGAIRGGKSIAVMGLVSGYYEIHQRFGRLPWEILFQQIIDLMNHGYYVSKTIEIAIDYFTLMGNKTQYRELWSTISDNGRPKRVGDVIRNRKLAQTLSVLAREPHAMRNGSLVGAMIREFGLVGGVITRDDLAHYKVKWREPVSVILSTGDTIYGMPPPSSGSLVLSSLNIIDKFSFDPSSLDSCNKGTLFFHRFIEIMKFAYAKRSILGDMDFENISQIVANITTDNYAKWIKSRIQDDRTHPVNYYDLNFADKEDHGTAHFSLLSQDGDAVSATLTINYLFGSLVMGSETGILYNDEMDDFSIPNKANIYNVYPSPSNFIKPGKRPMSSMSPIIVVNKYGDAKLVVGSSGGIKILSSTLLISSLATFFNREIKEAVDHPRIHHQLLPNKVEVEKTFPKPIIDGLKALGHVIEYGDGLGIGLGIQRSRDDSSYLECSVDFRKMGSCGGH